MTEPSALTNELTREAIRAWLEENCPPAMRTWLPADEVVWGGSRETFRHPDSRLWLQRMVDRGWVAPTWPAPYGGAGMSAAQAQVLREELDRIEARPPVISFALSMLGPALMEFASEAQKLEHLPRIARGEVRWCQGYSEPGAGSDLADVQTRAEDQGDHYVVTGTKIWTSYADQADWMFCLVRTDPGARKQQGIGFLLIDMRLPGISTAPIRLISGASPFCQVHLDQVRVPKAQLVGRPDQGWTIAKRLLEFERQWFAELDEERIGHIVGVGGHSEPLDALARHYGGEAALDNDPVLRHRIAEHAMKEHALQLTHERAAAEAEAGQGNDLMASVFKYCGAQLFKARYDLMVEIMGTQGLGWQGPHYDAKELDITRNWLRSKGNSIEGGSSEIQLNILAKRALGLPD